jgi:hypothetical protein
LPTFIKDIGPIIGLVSFAAFICLLVLYLHGLRELRRLRRDAPFLAEQNGSPSRRQPTR